MGTLLIIDWLPSEVTEQRLRKLFELFGEVRSVRIVTDGYGRSLAFGYVGMMTSEAAARARQELDGTELNGHVIHVAGHFTASRGNRLVATT
jgi:RNA recognition motif-containing protein